MVVGGAGLLLMALAGLWAYISLTSPPLHPNPQDVPSVRQAEPPPRWSTAVTQAGRLARAPLASRNLPGLSVAVAAGGEIVWAEGFGWADLEQHVKVEPRT